MQKVSVRGTGTCCSLTWSSWCRAVKCKCHSSILKSASLWSHPTAACNRLSERLRILIYVNHGCNQASWRAHNRSVQDIIIVSESKRPLSLEGVGLLERACCYYMLLGLFWAPIGICASRLLPQPFVKPSGGLLWDCIQTRGVMRIYLHHTHTHTHRVRRRTAFAPPSRSYTQNRRKRNLKFSDEAGLPVYVYVHRYSPTSQLPDGIPIKRFSNNKACLCESFLFKMTRL